MRPWLVVVLLVAAAGEAPVGEPVRAPWTPSHEASLGTYPIPPIVGMSGVAPAPGVVR